MSSLRQKISDLHACGHSPNAIAVELGVAPATVRYHLARLRAASADETVDAPDPGTDRRTAVTRRETRERVAELLAAGLTRREIARRLGLAKATVSYHARRLGAPVDARCARRYDWDAIQRYYNEGHTVRECMAAFGFTSAAWSDAVRRGAVRSRPVATPMDELLVADRYRGRYNLKIRLLREGLKRGECERCGIREWRGAPLTMALHHVNGERNDNRLENLELLCPNCHSQTDTFAGRGGRGRGRTDIVG